MTLPPPTIVAYLGAAQALTELRRQTFTLIGDAIESGAPLDAFISQLLAIWKAFSELHVPADCLKLHHAHHEAMKMVMALFTEGVIPLDMAQVRQLQADAHESFAIERQEMIGLISRFK